MIRLGLIGEGIGRSRTPRMHECEAARQGLALRYEILDPLQMPGRPSLKAILAHVRAQGFAGVNVTHPFKQLALDHVDCLAPEAAAIGALNTIVFADGTATGHNTDASGFAASLAEALPEGVPASTLLIGAGGAGRAVAFALKSAGTARLLVYDRDAEAAAVLASAVGGEPVDDLAEAANAAGGIVNATPVGMAAHPGLPIAPELVAARHVVADLVYLPLETALLAHARALGCRTLSGRGMAIAQAAHAFALFTGRTADAAAMAATFDSFEPD